MCLWYTLLHLPTSKSIAAIAEPHEKLTFFSFPNLVIYQQISKISLKDFILTSCFVWSKSLFFFRIWIIPPPKKRNPVSSATSTYHMMEKEIHWCSDLWGHRHGVRIYCQNFFFIWLGLFHLLLFNSMIRASPPPNSTLEMRILFSNYSTLNSVCKLPDSKNISIKTSSSF